MRRLRAFLFGSGIGAWLLMGTFLLLGLSRYPVGQAVPAEVYTAPFDPCDPAYKFFQIHYGEPNKPRWQAAPDDWVRQFGDSERTMLIHAVSELRVVVAAQGKRLLALEAWQKNQPVWTELTSSDVDYRTWNFGPADPNGALFGYRIDPNEGKK